MTARLLRFDGRPSGAALAVIAACIAVAFTAAFVARVSRGAEAPSAGTAVPESRLTGEVVTNADRAAAPRLRHAAALPPLARAALPHRHAAKHHSKPRVTETRVVTPAATPAATPDTTEAEPVATSAPPAATAPPAAPQVSAPPAKKPAAPAPTPGQTFDSSG
jgi:hypothetical protein